LNSAKIEIDHDNTTFTAVAEESVKISQSRSLMPSKAIFNVLKDDKLDFTEGDKVRIYIDDIGLFSGRIFSKSRDKEKLISVTAYDQLRYLKNKGTYFFTGKNVSGIIKTIAGDMNLTVGEIENSPYTVSDMICDDKTLFDIIQGAIDETYENTGTLFILTDDFGKISLKNCKNMAVDYSVLDSTAENFSYSSSIDNGVFNCIELTKKDRKNGDKEYFKKDENLQSRWGVLKYSGSVSDDEDGNLKAEKLLKLYGQKKRSLSINGAFGNSNVRAGSLIYVKMENETDIGIDSKMLCEEVEHIFNNGIYTMNIVLRGGLIND
jgi:hypothetical protein